MAFPACSWKGLSTSSSFRAIPRSFLLLCSPRFGLSCPTSARLFPPPCFVSFLSFFFSLFFFFSYTFSLLYARCRSKRDVCCREALFHLRATQRRTVANRPQRITRNNNEKSVSKCWWHVRFRGNCEIRAARPCWLGFLIIRALADSRFGRCASNWLINAGLQTAANWSIRTSLAVRRSICGCHEGPLRPAPGPRACVSEILRGNRIFKAKRVGEEEEEEEEDIQRGIFGSGIICFA